MTDYGLEQEIEQMRQERDAAQGRAAGLERQVERLQNSLRGIQQFAQEQSDRMDRLALDPDNNGEGSIPTGDDWNSLKSFIDKVAEKQFPPKNDT